MKTRKLLKYAFTAISTPIIFLTTAHASLLSECTSITNLINKSTPQVIDKITTLTSAICFPEGSTVILDYRNKLDIPSGVVDQGKLNSLKPQMLATWCTDPQQRQTLNLLNIRYTYTDASGKFIGKIDLSKSQCK